MGGNQLTASEGEISNNKQFELGCKDVNTPQDRPPDEFRRGNPQEEDNENVACVSASYLIL